MAKRVRKTSKKTLSQVLDSEAPTPNPDIEPGLLPALEALGNRMEKDLSDVSAIQMVYAGTYPSPTIQIIVKFHNAQKAWVVRVGPCTSLPDLLAEAVTAALSKDGDKGNRALFHMRKEQANDSLADIQHEFKDLIVGGSVEFVPYKGWVPVVYFPRDLDEDKLKPLAGRAECRPVEDPEQPPAPNKNKRKVAQEPEDTTPVKQGRRRKGRRNLQEDQPTPKRTPVSTPTPAPSGGVPTREDLEAMSTKSALLAKHKELFGKQPNNKLSKEEIIELILGKLDE